MKKILLGLAVGMVTLIFNSTATFAASTPGFTYDVKVDGINVIVETQETNNMESDVKKSIYEFAVTEGVFSEGEMTPREQLDLSENNAVINWTLQPSQIHINASPLKTNSKEINVSIKADPKASLTVYLYNASDLSELASATDTVGTGVNKNYRFTNLTAARTYRIGILTHEQFNSTISGKITD